MNEIALLKHQVAVLRGMLESLGLNATMLDNILAEPHEVSEEAPEDWPKHEDGTTIGYRERQMMEAIIADAPDVQQIRRNAIESKIGQLEVLGVDSVNLDNLVHDCASIDGTKANNGGFRGQLEFLYDRWGVVPANQAIDELVRELIPDDEDKDYEDEESDSGATGELE